MILNGQEVVQDRQSGWIIGAVGWIEGPEFKGGDPARGVVYTPGIKGGGVRYGAIKMMEDGIIDGGGGIVEDDGGIVEDDGDGIVEEGRFFVGRPLSEDVPC